MTFFTLEQFFRRTATRGLAVLAPTSASCCGGRQPESPTRSATRRTRKAVRQGTVGTTYSTRPTSSAKTSEYRNRILLISMVSIF